MTSPAAPSPHSPPRPPEPAGAPVGLWALFRLFLRAGLIFGGGLAVTAVLLQELVERRRAITRAYFLALYGLARLLPSGTTTALTLFLLHVLRWPALLSLAAGSAAGLALTRLLSGWPG